MPSRTDGLRRRRRDARLTHYPRHPDGAAKNWRIFKSGGGGDDGGAVVKEGGVRRFRVHITSFGTKQIIDHRVLKQIKELLFELNEMLMLSAKKLYLFELGRGQWETLAT